MHSHVQHRDARAAARILFAAALCALAVISSEGRAGASPRLNSEAGASANAGSQQRAPDPDNLVGHGGPVKSVAVSSDGKRAVTGSFDYSMMVWDLSVKPPKMLARFPEHDAGVNVVRFLPGEKSVLTAGDDGIVRIWDLDSGKLLQSFNGHTAKIVDVAFSPDGRWAASASWDHTVRLWDLQAGSAGPVLDEHKGPVNAVAFAPGEDGQGLALYSASTDGDIRLFDAVTGDFKRPIYRHGWGINCLKALPESGRLLFGALNGTAGVVNVASGDLRKVLTPHDGPVLALAVLPDKGLAATGGGDGTIRVWKTADWSAAEEYNNPFGPIWSLAFTPDGERIYYSGLDDFVTMWQVSPREPFEQVESKLPRRFQATDDMSLGQRQFARKCSICHTLKVNDGNRAGPTLYGVFGRRAGSLPGYAYSDALKKSDIIWNEDTIEELFARGPEHVTPGTKMPLQKMTNEQEREALIAYLKSATADADGQQPAPSRKEQ